MIVSMYINLICKTRSNSSYIKATFCLMSIVKINKQNKLKKKGGSRILGQLGFWED